jgi:DNA-binding IclR family transcriptional regulator
MTDPRAHQVLDLIRNAPQPLKRREVSQRTGIPERTVTALVSALRKKGEPICNDLAGYTYDDTPAKLQVTAAIMKAQAFDMLETASAIEARASRTGQYSIL